MTEKWPGVRLDLRVDTPALFGLLNGDVVQANRFWIGNDVGETNCMLSDPDEIQQGREFYGRLLQHCVDEWIDSGRREGGSERAADRNERAAPDATREAKYFWETSRLENMGTQIVLVPKEQNSFDSPYWKARRGIVAILYTDLRLRIAKCRYRICKEPYFELTSRHDHLYLSGFYCKTEHNNAANARRNSAKYRAEQNRQKIVIASKFLVRRGRLSPIWDFELRRDLLDAINRQFAPSQAVHSNWLTRHHDEIEAKVKQLKKLDRSNSR